MALLVCMSAGREGERAEHLTFLRFRRSNFSEQGAGVGFSVDLYPRRRRILYACQIISWRFRRVNISEKGAEGRVFGGYLPSATALLYECQWVGRASALIIFFI